MDYEAQSNVIKLDGKGNVITDGSEESIVLTIKDVGSGILDIGRHSVDETFNKLADFVNKFNASMALSNIASLAEDSGLQALLSSINSALTDDIGDKDKIQQKLAEIGIILYSTPTSDGRTRLSISLNRDKFVDTFINDSQKVMDLLVGDDTSDPIDPEVAGSFTRVKAVFDDSLNPISGYFKANTRILQAQKQAMDKEVTLNKGELARLKAELEINTGSDELEKNREQLEKLLRDMQEQYQTVNDLINKLNKQYSATLSVLVMNKHNPAFQ